MPCDVGPQGGGGHWRTFDDAQDDWGSVSRIIEFWGCSSNVGCGRGFETVAGPGRFQDADMLIVGNTPCAPEVACPRLGC